MCGLVEVDGEDDWGNSEGCESCEVFEDEVVLGWGVEVVVFKDFEEDVEGAGEKEVDHCSGVLLRGEEEYY